MMLTRRFVLLCGLLGLGAGQAKRRGAGPRGGVVTATVTGTFQGRASAAVTFSTCGQNASRLVASLLKPEWRRAGETTRCRTATPAGKTGTVYIDSPSHAGLNTADKCMLPLFKNLATARSTSVSDWCCPSVPR